ncbi:MAG TPA: hypothetical protein VIL51_06045 [Thermoleophilia bacterium]
MRTFGTTEGRPRSVVTAMLLMALLLAAAVVVLSGCGNSPTTSTALSQTTVSSQGGDTTTVGQGDASTTTTLALGSDPVYDRKLKVTALAVQALSGFLQDQNVAVDDPRIGLLYGLRAQEQAITARKALAHNVYTTADAAMKDIYSTISLGRTVATGTVLATLDQAYKTVENLGVPSASPDNAATLLDQFIAQLDPLIAQANSISSSSTTSTS